MKTYKITKGDKQYVIKAKDTYSAVVKLHTILKDQKQVAKFTKFNNGDVAEGFIMETNKGFTFTSPQNPKDDKDFPTQKLAENHANKLGYVKDSKPIEDDRLSPMTYKKLKELGYDKNKWQNLTQEQANKIVQSNGTSNSNSGNKSTSTKPSRQQQIQSAYNKLKKESEAAFDKFKNKATTLAERDQYEKEYNQVQAKMSKFLNKYDLNNRESVSKLNSEFEKTRYDQPKTARTNNKQIIENNKQKTRKLSYPSHEVAQGIEEFADAKSTEDRRAIIKDLRNTAIRNAERNKTNVCEGSNGEKYKFDITDGSNYSKAFRMALGGVPVTVNGRIARVKFVTPDEYLAQSAKQKGISTSELLTNTDDEAYQNVLSGLKKDKTLSSGIYMDYSNKSQEGNRRVRALKELGVTSIPVLYVGRKWDKEKDNIALHY